MLPSGSRLSLSSGPVACEQVKQTTFPGMAMVCLSDAEGGPLESGGGLGGPLGRRGALNGRNPCPASFSAPISTDLVLYLGLMLQLTKRTEYALIALTVLAGREGEVVSVREIGELYPVPRRLLAEVLKELSRAGILASQRGSNGGYFLTRPAAEINVAQVVGALEGLPAIAGCSSEDFEPGACEVEPVCPIRSPIQRLRIGVWAVFERMSLRDLAEPARPPLSRAVPVGSGASDGSSSGSGSEA